MNPSKSTTKKSKGFTDEEKAAMKARARELKAEAEQADGENAHQSAAELTGLVMPRVE